MIAMIAIQMTCQSADLKCYYCNAEAALPGYNNHTGRLADCTNDNRTVQTLTLRFLLAKDADVVQRATLDLFDGSSVGEELSAAAPARHRR